MLFTPQVSEFDYEKPNIKIHKINKQLLIPKSHQETKSRTSRALSDLQGQTSKKMNFQEEIRKLESIKKPEMLKKEIFRQIKQTCKEFRNIERERDGSQWIKSYCTNEKIKVSNLLQETPFTKGFSFRNFYSRQNSRGKVQLKRKPVDLPQTKPIPSKPKSQQIRLRFKYKSPISDNTNNEIQTERINHQPKQSEKKLIQSNQLDIFDEMLDFYNQDRIVTIVQDVQHRKIDFKKIQHELMKTLQYISRLHLDIYSAFSDQVISQTPFQKKNSYEFIQAAKQGKEWEVKEFLKENRFLVHDFDYIYMTALHWACKRGHFEIVQQLVEKGADLEFQDIIGRPALYFAIVGGNPAIVKYLLDKKADPWSNKAVNYNQLCNEYNPALMILISNARKAHITLKMTPPAQRESIWKILRR